MMPSTLDEARQFLTVKRIAVVGLSRDPRSLSRTVFRALLERGYDAVPVNPALDAAEGRRAFARLGDVTPPVEAALVMTPAERSAGVVRECLAAGVRRVWLHRGSGPGAVSLDAVALARGSGLRLVVGLCPMMALPGAGWFHRLHARLRTRHGTA